MSRKLSGKSRALEALQISVMGDVQGVGYRRSVQRLARELGIAGFIKNLKDGRVLIRAQGPGPNLDEFSKAVRIREAPIDVKEIEIKHVKPSRSLKFFGIRRGILPEEMDEALSAGEGQLKLLRKDFADFSESTNRNFGTLANRYDKISETLGSVLRESAQTRDDFKQALEKMTIQTKEFKDSIETLTNLAREYFESRKKQ